MAFTRQQFRNRVPSDRSVLSRSDVPADWKPRARQIPSFDIDPYAAATGDPEALAKYLDQLINAVAGRMDVSVTYGTATTIAGIALEGNQNRNYLFVQNLSAAQVLVVGVNYAPTITTGVRLGSQGIAFEPAKVPVGDIYLIADADCEYIVLSGTPMQTA